MSGNTKSERGSDYLLLTSKQISEQFYLSLSFSVPCALVQLDLFRASLEPTQQQSHTAKFLQPALARQPRHRRHHPPLSVHV